MHPRNLLLITLACVLLLLVGASMTGYVTFYHDDARAVVGSDSVRLSADSLQVCCKLANNKTCAVLAPYDCGHCKEFCKT